MKRILLSLILLFLMSFVHAEDLGITYTEIGSGMLNSDQTDQQQNASQMATLSQLNAKLSKVATQEEVDINFKTLDYQMKRYAEANQQFEIVFILIVIILNDIALFSIFGLLRAKGYV